ncbi:GGDEF domain-containing protein [Thalassolituus hydrocarboniclasticus]|uniref:diguanylate cyclase n=1 Tax=Thalassolituus hydrocarboniclasticus TaxID=2742796 RepID=A0ABY6ADL2_9GAMM|nr:GGDEF domain-containing protein [Thalassolituus hydrocarboniclasticus]UXD87925.1 GGDEF domain-containing protein [Thalassolituus hydrocarboniclasticus]
MNNTPDASQEATQGAAVVTVLNSLDALIYVADMSTYELLFINDYARQKWGEPGNKRCWEYLQKDQQGPCTFCTNHKLLDEQQQPTGVYVWEFQNTQNKHWYQCRDEAIRWIDGRLVRIEIATDISDRKRMEQELEAARREAEYLAGTDALTRLNNRRAFFKLGEQVLKEAQRFGRPTSIIMFDLDHFKQINDTWGHSAGDAVLQRVATLAEATIRNADILARIGGEEFAILLPQTDMPQARILAERIRQTLDSDTLLINGTDIHVQASFGISSCEHCDDLTLAGLLNIADEQLYLSKQHGRNRISVHQISKP